MEKVTQLYTVASSASPETVVSNLKRFVVANELLVEWDDDGVELESPNNDEVKLGNLNQFERECYVIGMLLQEVVRQAMIDLEASSTEEISQIMRAERVNMPTAVNMYRERINEFLDTEDQVYLNQCALTIAFCMTQYEWSVRGRYDLWAGQIIVRDGFTIYKYG